MTLLQSNHYIFHSWNDRPLVASIGLLLAGCGCAILQDMNTVSLVTTIGFPLLALAAIGGYPATIKYHTLCLLFVYFLSLCLCRAVGGMDYFHVGRISKLQAFGITLACELPIMALVFGAFCIQRKMYTHNSCCGFLVFPVLLTAIYQLLFEYSPIGSTSSPSMGVALLLSPGLRQAVVSTAGELGVVFGIGVVASIGAGTLLGRVSQRHWILLVGMLAVLDVWGGTTEEAGLFQDPIQDWPISTASNLQVSCMCPTHLLQTNTSNFLVRIQERLDAGDDLVIVSEASFGQRILPGQFQWPSHNPGAVVAVTYMEALASNTTFHNSVELLQAGQSLLRYDKNNPVPILEADVVPGKTPPTIRSVTFTPFATNHSTAPWRTNFTLQVSTAICFDFEFPNLIRNAHNADLIIGPSNYWASIGTALWSDNLYRSIENDFTLIKCARNGISGAAWNGNLLASKPTLAGDTYKLQVPVQPGKSTVYATFGYAWGWGCVIVSCGILLWVYWPGRAVFSATVNHSANDEEEERDLEESTITDINTTATSSLLGHLDNSIVDIDSFLQEPLLARMRSEEESIDIEPLDLAASAQNASADSARVRSEEKRVDVEPLDLGASARTLSAGNNVYADLSRMRSEEESIDVTPLDLVASDDDSMQ